MENKYKIVYNCYQSPIKFEVDPGYDVYATTDDPKEALLLLIELREKIRAGEIMNTVGKDIVITNEQICLRSLMMMR